MLFPRPANDVADLLEKEQVPEASVSDESSVVEAPTALQEELVLEAAKAESKLAEVNEDAESAQELTEPMTGVKDSKEPSHETVKQVKPEANSEPAVKAAAETVPDAVEKEQHAESDQAVTEVSDSPLTEKQLRKHRTVELRNMARQLSGLGLSKKQIKFARKDELIKAIADYYKAAKS